MAPIGSLYHHTHGLTILLSDSHLSQYQSPRHHLDHPEPPLRRSLKHPPLLNLLNYPLQSHPTLLKIMNLAMKKMIGPQNQKMMKRHLPIQIQTRIDPNLQPIQGPPSNPSHRGNLRKLRQSISELHQLLKERGDPNTILD